jgi:hypothetical protein
MSAFFIFCTEAGTLFSRFASAQVGIVRFELTQPKAPVLQTGPTLQRWRIPLTIYEDSNLDLLIRTQRLFRPDSYRDEL